MTDIVYPQSYYSDPMVSTTPEPSGYNTLAQTGLDLLRLGLGRIIDVQTVNALKGTNTVAVLQSDGATITTAPGYGMPMVAGAPGAFLGIGLVPVLLGVGLIWLISDKG
ncbi:hypothetical protein K6V92_00400 [Cupriavidus respiraculi]|uniref:hypothetical protein n=1 Tax=Cupriavidus respiraculi TaxID=195930 RepID=UPI001C98C717|nr:hypothetical protein [Cupriavidus respiraculi]MBY4945084.1 hypothetical protein [Cupriavidus respiraculi]